MSDPSLELQSAIIDVLKDRTGTAVDDRVYDEPPVNPIFPYITLGQCQVLPDKADCIDGVIAYPVVDIWSQQKGFVELKTITKAVLAMLDDQPLAIAGFTVVVFEIESVNYLRDPDGLTRHAALTFHALIQPT
ncbi:MAG: DUF3168 domain-containing protein [Rhizobiales bacterium]|nr:DUF3168 domain-containing protein [Hyphomicrobiales bacterium]